MGEQSRECSTCRYARGGDGGLECRRFPPVPLQGSVYIAGVSGQGRFAIVEPRSWCGEHRYSTQGAPAEATA